MWATVNDFAGTKASTKEYPCQRTFNQSTGKPRVRHRSERNITRPKFPLFIKQGFWGRQRAGVEQKDRTKGNRDNVGADTLRGGGVEAGERLRARGNPVNLAGSAAR